MARTDADSVVGILMKDWDCNMAVEPFIRTASVLISRVQDCASKKGITVDEDTLTEVETWLAAHLYSVSDRPYSQKRTQQAWARFQGTTGMGFDSSHYGQTAMQLDPSGCLKAINTGARASARWLGKTKTEEIPYEDRN